MWLLCTQEAWRDSGLSRPANGKRLSRDLIPLLYGAEPEPQPEERPYVLRSLLCQGVLWPYLKAAALGESFSVHPLESIFLGCLISTGAIPLLSLANHALKHTRRACTTFSSSSSMYRWKHLTQRHPRIGNRLNICSTEMYLSEELPFVFNTCSSDLTLSAEPLLQPFPPGTTSCLIEMGPERPSGREQKLFVCPCAQGSIQLHPASSRPRSLSGERDRVVLYPLHISSSLLYAAAVWIKFFSQSYYHKESLGDFTV